MRRKLGYIGLIMVWIAAVGAAFSYAFGNVSSSHTHGESEPELRVVTSFYPVYIIVLNLTEGVPGVEVQNLTENQTGCLHDYQLTTRDMRLLEQADAFFVNGGGMENFLEEAAKNLPGLPVISSEEGIELLPGEAHTHENHADGYDNGSQADMPEEAHTHEGGQKEGTLWTDSMERDTGNAHIWMDPRRYQAQIRNLADGLIALDPTHRAAYEKNRDRYLEQVEEIAKEYQEAFLGAEVQPVLLFHEAFVYLAEAAPLEVIETVELEGEERALSAGELVELIEEIRFHQISYLLVEGNGKQGEAEQESTVVEAIAKESGAQIVTLDPLTTGEENADSWLKGMRENLKVLVSVFSISDRMEEDR